MNDDSAAGDGVVVEVRGLTRRFGGITAVDDLSLKIKRGGLHAIVGPNGAGKSTLFNLITRQTDPSAGTVLLRGRDITRLPVEALPHLGLARTFQKTDLFWNLSAAENVRLAVQARKVGGYPLFRPHSAYSEVIRQVDEILGELGLSERAALPVSSLSHGDQRIVEIAVALGSSPEVLLLDEPLAGMSALETTRAVSLFRKLKQRLTLVLIEHDMDAVLALADRIVVLNFGRIIADGTPAEVRGNDEVQHAYFGIEAA